MYKKILIPIDGSKPSDKALEHIINLLQQCKKDDYDNEVIILHVIPDFPTPIEFEKPMRSNKTGEMISLSDYIEEMDSIILLKSKEMVYDREKKFESSGLFIKTDVIVEGNGSIANNIIEYANKEKVDMIAIGNVGLGGINKYKALGSVSRRVSEMSKCPVLIVH